MKVEFVGTDEGVMKTCCTCKKEKELSEFSKNGGSKDGLQIRCKACTHSHYVKNRGAVLLRVSAYQEDHREEILLKKAVYRSTRRKELSEKQLAYHAKHRDESLARNALWKINNPNYMKEWRKDNAEKVRIHRRRRRALKAELEEHWTELQELCLADFQPVCVICGGTNKLAADHVRPLSKGHPLEPGNAVRLCQHCNSTKKDRELDDLPEGWKEIILKAAEEFRVAWSGGF